MPRSISSPRSRLSGSSSRSLRSPRLPPPQPPSISESIRNYGPDAACRQAENLVYSLYCTLHAYAILLSPSNAFPSLEPIVPRGARSSFGAPPGRSHPVHGHVQNGIKFLLSVIQSLDGMVSRGSEIPPPLNIYPDLGLPLPSQLDGHEGWAAYYIYVAKGITRMQRKLEATMVELMSQPNRREGLNELVTSLKHGEESTYETMISRLKTLSGIASPTSEPSLPDFAPSPATPAETPIGPNRSRIRRSSRDRRGPIQPSTGALTPVAETRHPESHPSQPEVATQQPLDTALGINLSWEGLEHLAPAAASSPVLKLDIPDDFRSLPSDSDSDSDSDSESLGSHTDLDTPMQNPLSDPTSDAEHGRLTAPTTPGTLHPAGVPKELLPLQAPVDASMVITFTPPSPEDEPSAILRAQSIEPVVSGSTQEAPKEPNSATDNKLPVRQNDSATDVSNAIPSHDVPTITGFIQITAGDQNDDAAPQSDEPPAVAMIPAPITASLRDSSPKKGAQPSSPIVHTTASARTTPRPTVSPLRTSLDASAPPSVPAMSSSPPRGRRSYTVTLETEEEVEDMQIRDEKPSGASLAREATFRPAVRAPSSGRDSKQLRTYLPSPATPHTPISEVVPRDRSVPRGRESRDPGDRARHTRQSSPLRCQCQTHRVKCCCHKSWPQQSCLQRFLVECHQTNVDLPPRSIATWSDSSSASTTTSCLPSPPPTPPRPAYNQIGKHVLKERLYSTSTPIHLERLEKNNRWFVRSAGKAFRNQKYNHVSVVDHDGIRVVDFRKAADRS